MKNLKTSRQKIKDKIFGQAHNHISDHLGTPIIFLSIPGKPEGTCLFKTEREQIKIGAEIGWYLNISATIVSNGHMIPKRRDQVEIEGVQYYVQEVYREGGERLTLILAQ